MIVLGAYARIDPAEPEATRRRLDALPGVETFGLDDPLRVGLIIEAATLDDAHAQIRQVIPAVEGVLGVWPIFVGDATARWDDPGNLQQVVPPAGHPGRENSGVQGV